LFLDDVVKTERDDRRATGREDENDFEEEREQDLSEKDLLRPWAVCNTIIQI